MEVNSKTSSHGTAEISSSHGTEFAFHPESLNVIAKFNERRCQGMPLYGQDLIEVLTIVSPEASCSQPKMASKTWKVHSLEISGFFYISLRFYVKSILETIELQNQPF